MHTPSDDRKQSSITNEQKIAAWVRDHPMLCALVIVFVPATVGLFVANQYSDETGGKAELSKALYVASITLIFGGLVTGLLKIVFGNFTLNRQRHQDNATFLSNVLNDLKSVYDRVGRVRILVPAHKSAKTYGDEMRDLIESRVTLRNVIRALDSRPDEGLFDERNPNPKPSVEQMERYLKTLTDEFQNEYKKLSNLQRVYEQRVASQLADPKGENKQRIFDNEEVALALGKLEHLNGLISDNKKSAFAVEFEAPLDDASRILRRRLQNIVTGHALLLTAAPAKPAPVASAAASGEEGAG